MRRASLVLLLVLALAAAGCGSSSKKTSKGGVKEGGTLRLAGKLENIVGVVVGEMVKCDWHEGRPEWPRTKSLEDALEEHLEPLHVPVIFKLPLGHGKHLATLPLGVTCTLDGDARTLTVDESPFA